LLLLGQERARMSLVVDGESATFAAGFESGVNFLDRFGISGGMPTRVSIQRSKLEAALRSLGVPDRPARGFLDRLFTRAKTCGNSANPRVRNPPNPIR